MYEDDNKTTVGIIVIGFILLTVWICHDIGRNKPIYNNTDTVLDTIEVRVDDAGKRIDSVSESVGNAEKAVTEAVGRIERSEESAGEIASRIDECEKRLDSIIQRQGRIKNLIIDIERTNK